MTIPVPTRYTLGDGLSVRLSGGGANGRASGDANFVGPVRSRKSPISYRRRPEDTATGCRANAAADLVRAGAPATAHVRWRYEHSAAAWTARAERLERFDDHFHALVAGAPR